jgi:triacylglycerol esterase/lipase EstA (alpha/beta hydrolase family)
MKRLRLHGHAFIAVNLEPVFGSIDDYAPIVQAAVQRMTEATGMAPILVCHSMGGVVARRWLNLQESAAVHHVITIASPHHGTWLARFSASPNARQLGIRSEWLLQLQRDEAEHPRPPFTCWYTNCDNIVFPTSSACLPAANNRLLRGAGHVDLAFRPEVMQASLAIALGHEH